MKIKILLVLIFTFIFTAFLTMGCNSRASETNTWDSLQVRYLKTDIGPWDMKSTQTIHVMHNLPLSKIIKVEVWIHDDAEMFIFPLSFISSSGQSNGVFYISRTSIVLGRTSGGFFDSTDYDSIEINRGIVVIEYTE